MHTVLTGYKPTKNSPGNEFPSVGSIVAKELGPRANGMPPYIATMQAIDSSNAAYLGVEYNPFQTFGYPQSPGFQGAQHGAARRRRSKPARTAAVDAPAVR